jgi:predicted dinucleotide-binding enzyme
MLNKIVVNILTALFMFLAMSINGYTETIAMIGTGDVSSALGPRFAQLGHKVIYGSRSPDRADVSELVARSGDGSFATSQRQAATQADIVVLAVPWNVAEEVVLNLGDLSGKIIMDPINPRVMDAEGNRDFPTHVSNAERIQNLAPRAFVVKAFSTMSADTMIDPDLLGHKLTVPLVGDDQSAKDRIAEIVEEMGYESVDVGPVRYAHIIEGLYLLRTNTRALRGHDYEYHFRQRPEDKARR